MQHSRRPRSPGAARQWLMATLRAYARRIEARSAVIPQLLTRNMDRIALGWMAVFLLASGPAVLFSVTPARNLSELASLLLPYVIIAAAPVAGLQLALRAFPNGLMTARAAPEPFALWPLAPGQPGRSA